MSIEAQRVLKERYRLIRPVGHGSQASVWVAEHLALSTQVAVKLIDPELAKRDSARDRFKREATAAARLRSAHVVQMLDHGIDGDQPFIVMELLEGEDLYERLNKRGRLSLRETSKIVTQIARALTRAHAAGIVHRDLKPENVFLVPNDDDEVVKVLDFGVAKIADPARVTRQTGLGTLIGTPHYMSFEQVKGTHEIDHRSDLWSLGVIAYQCVTGDLPFDSQGVGDLLIKISVEPIPVPSKVRSDIPAAFDEWFAKACERDLEKRFQSAREMAVSLATLAGEVTRSPTIKPPRPASIAPPRPASAPAIKVPVTKSSKPPPRPIATAEELDSSFLEEDDDVDGGWGDEDEPQITTSEPPPALSPSKAPPRPASIPPRPNVTAMKPVASPSARPTPRPPLAKAAERPSDKPVEKVEEKAPPPAAEAAPPPPRRPTPPEPPAEKVVINADNAVKAPVSEKKPQVQTPPPVAEEIALTSGDLHDASEVPHVEALDEPEPIPLATRVREPDPEPVEPPPVAPPPAEPRVVIPRPPATPRVVEASAPSSDRRPSAPGFAPTTVSGVSRPGLETDPPPELDGSKRKRLVSYLLLGMAAAAGYIVWQVVRSQMLPPPRPPVAATHAPPAQPTPVETVAPPPPEPEPSTSAVDPGTLKHPPKPTPSAKAPPPRGTPRERPQDGTIVIPDPAGD